MGRVKITISKENILRNGPIISDMFPSLLAWMDEKIRCLGEAAIFGRRRKSLIRLIHFKHTFTQILELMPKERLLK